MISSVIASECRTPSLQNGVVDHRNTEYTYLREDALLSIRMNSLNKEPY